MTFGPLIALAAVANRGVMPLPRLDGAPIDVPSLFAGQSKGVAAMCHIHRSVGLPPPSIHRLTGWRRRSIPRNLAMSFG